ncbi:kinase-like protein [Calocera cornea HHB12733]|uniref:Kinase-like protein n=1 Tax=Calocera cornea HHB12733 TaxID=1353952 RepID=A0A165G267_9BASI|nr:kinase-like protein [Calocera cornea HHB12733]
MEHQAPVIPEGHLPVTHVQTELHELAELRDAHLRFLDSTRGTAEFMTVHRIQYEVQRGERLGSQTTLFLEVQAASLEGRQTLASTYADTIIRAAKNHSERIQNTWTELDGILEARTTTQRLLQYQGAPGTVLLPHPLPGPLVELFAPDLTSSVQPDPPIVPLYRTAWADTYRGFLYQGNQTPLRVALKSSRFFGVTSSQQRHSIAREVLVSLRSQHPNILPFLGSVYLPVSNGVCLVSPWMDNGHVLDYVVRNNPSFSLVLGLLRGIAAGLDFLHTQRPAIVHGDIKGSNVLVDDDGRPRLADFGFARYVDLDILQSTPSAAQGTVPFKAPERLDPVKFGLSTMQTWIPAIDVFSFGMLSWELLAHRPPFYQYSSWLWVSLILGGVRPDIPEDWTSSPAMNSVVGCMTSCWQEDRALRPSMQDVRNNL